MNRFMRKIGPAHGYTCKYTISTIRYIDAFDYIQNVPKRMKRALQFFTCWKYVGNLGCKIDQNKVGNEITLMKW